MIIDLACPNCAHCLMSVAEDTFTDKMGKIETCSNCGKQFEVLKKHFQKHLDPEKRKKVMAMKAKAKAMVAEEKLASKSKPSQKSIQIDSSPAVIDSVKPESITATKKCPYCAEEILLEAIKCKHCRENLEQQITPSQSPSQEEVKWSDISIGEKIFGTIVIIIGILFLFHVVSWFFKEREKDYSLDAYVLCQMMIERQLKSPGTAEFPAYGDRTKKDKKTHKYIVVSYVDAQNSFGAKIRANWTCTATLSGGDPDEPSNWQVKARLKE